MSVTGLQTRGSPRPSPAGPAAARLAVPVLAFAAFIAAALLALPGCASIPRPPPSAATVEREPANLWHLKQELKAYIDSGAYERGVAAIAAEAKAWIEHRVTPPADPDRRGLEKLAVVFDLDETLLSNLPHMRARDFGYEPAVWDAWVEQAAAPALPAVAEVYHAARRRGVTVFYITGRNDNGRAPTEANLRHLGLADHAALFCKPAGSRETSQAFKTALRKRLTEQGYTIIANIGDQESDLAGGYAERTFKLPNPFYITK